MNSAAVRTFCFNLRYLLVLVATPLIARYSECDIVKLVSIPHCKQHLHLRRLAKERFQEDISRTFTKLRACLMEKN